MDQTKSKLGAEPMWPERFEVGKSRLDGWHVWDTRGRRLVCSCQKLEDATHIAWSLNQTQHSVADMPAVPSWDGEPA